MIIKKILFVTILIAMPYSYASQEPKDKEFISNISELSQLRKDQEFRKQQIELVGKSFSLMIDIESKKPAVIEHQPRQQDIVDLLSLASVCIAGKYHEHPIIKPLADEAYSMLQYNYRVFHLHPIYFGKTSEGYHYCAPINKHENNPDFEKVTLALFQGHSLFFNPFKIIGTYSDKNKRQLLKNRITQDGGLWCPEQKAFIGGTRDKSMCNAFAEFEKEYKKPTLFKKLKKIITNQYE